MKNAIVLHVRATNFFGGPEKQIYEHIIRSRNYRHSLVTFIDSDEKNELLDRCRDASIPLHAVKASNPFSPLTILRLRQIVSKLNPSIICTHGYRSTLLLLAATIRSGIPIIGFARGFTGENLKVAFFESLERRALSHLYGIICVCEAQRQQLEEAGVCAKNCWMVHNAVNSSHPSIDPVASGNLRKSLGIGDGGALVVSAGRLSPEKGHMDLLHAIRLMPNYGNENHFVFCGDGPCKKLLEQEAHALGISHRVRFTGHRRDLMDIFGIMDLLVLPSHTEGLPNVILEGFSCEKPVVATRVGGVPEVVEDGRNGILVPPGRPDMLAAAIEACLASPVKMASMGKEGKSKVQSEFSFERQAQRLESIYDDVLSAAKTGKSQNAQWRGGRDKKARE